MNAGYEPLHWYLGRRIRRRAVWFHRCGILQSFVVKRHMPFKETARARDRALARRAEERRVS